MAATKTKAAFGIFSLSFGTWLALVWSICLPNGTWVTPIRFPNTLTLTVFMVSAVVAAVSCGVIGIDYLGITFRGANRKSALSPASQNLVLQEPQISVAESPEVTVADVDKADLDIFTLMLTEEEETKQEV